MPETSEKQIVTSAKPKIGGAISFAPIGTVVPTDAVAELNPSFIKLGYCDDNGLVNAPDKGSDSIKAWGGDAVMDSAKEFKDIFKYTLLGSLDENVLKHVFGAKNVLGTLSSGITIKVNDSDYPEWALVVDMILKENAVKRIVIPRGKIQKIGDIVYKDGEPIGYELEVAAYVDEAGNNHYEYIKSAGK